MRNILIWKNFMRSLITHISIAGALLLWAMNSHIPH